MDVKALFNLGKGYLDKEDYVKANEYFWKIFDQIHDPEQVKLFQEKASDFDPEVTAIFLQCMLEQLL